ncbi:hypothetical protein BASA81_001471 [Batrachochytrium salamandrivorans]|nr:hypothetical protein BASA81_001471 [Batrachochytrium salamandrivorans]
MEPNKRARKELRRCVALLDMDCFYVAVERELDPTLRGVPVAVAQYTAGAPLVAVSYEAKALGVKRGMLSHDAQVKFPELRISKIQTKNGKADLNKYRQASDRVIAVACRFCPVIEKASVDEFYLDLSNLLDQTEGEDLEEEEDLEEDEALANTLVCTGFDTVTQEPIQDLLLRRACRMVWEIRRAIRDELGFDCSAGIAGNKFLAKSIAGIRKPFTQIALPTEHVSSVCATLPIQKAKSLGGKRGEQLMEQYDELKMLGDLRVVVGAAKLCEIFGQREGNRLVKLSVGEDDTAVSRTTMHKSMAASKMFRGKAVLTSRGEIARWMNMLVLEIIERLGEDGRRPATIIAGVWGLGSRSTSTFTWPLTVQSLNALANALLDRLLERMETLKVHSLSLTLAGFPSENLMENNAVVALGKWTCKLCTLENDLEWLRCDACGSDKLGHVTAVSAPPPALATPVVTAVGTTWTCGHCTFAGNDLRFLRCEVCGLSK